MAINIIYKLISRLQSYNNAKLIKDLNDGIDAINLKRMLKIRAVESSADYILKNFSNAIFFESREDLYNYIINNNIITKNYFEFGVFKGDSINYFSNSIKDLTFYGFDSFEGLPETWRPGFEMGEFDLNGIMPKVNENVYLIKGLFHESLPSFLKDNKLIGPLFLHIDCDLYSSTQIIFENLKNYLVKGTFILFDEYLNYPFWQQHEFRAFQEFVAKYEIKYEYTAININHEQVLIRIK